MAERTLPELRGHSALLVGKTRHRRFLAINISRQVDLDFADIHFLVALIEFSPVRKILLRRRVFPANDPAAFPFNDTVLRSMNVQHTHRILRLLRPFLETHAGNGNDCGDQVRMILRHPVAHETAIGQARYINFFLIDTVLLEGPENQAA